MEDKNSLRKKKHEFYLTTSESETEAYVVLLRRKGTDANSGCVGFHDSVHLPNILRGHTQPGADTSHCTVWGGYKRISSCKWKQTLNTHREICYFKRRFQRKARIGIYSRYLTALALAGTTAVRSGRFPFMMRQSHTRGQSCTCSADRGGCGGAPSDSALHSRCTPRDC